MRDHEWSVLDSLAFELSPDNAVVGRNALTKRLQQTEASLIAIFKSIDLVVSIVLGLATALLILSIFVAFSSNSDAEIIFKSILWPLSAGSLLYLTSCVWRYPGLNFLLPKVLKHQDLQIFRDHLRRMADGEIEVWDKYDRLIAPAYLRSPWTVLIYSDLDEARTIPLSPRFQRYRDGLLTRRPAEKLGMALQGLSSQPTTSTQIAPNTLTEDETFGLSNSRHDPHWLSTINEREFHPLLMELSALWEGVKAQQIETMLGAAHTLARQTPEISVASLSRAAINSLKSNALPIGLDGGTSDDWIRRMLGWEKVHKYRFVRLHFTDQRYQLPQRLSKQMGLDF